MSDDAKVTEQAAKSAAESASPEREPVAAQQGNMRPEDPKHADDVLKKNKHERVVMTRRPRQQTPRCWPLREGGRDGRS